MSDVDETAPTYRYRGPLESSYPFKSIRAGFEENAFLVRRYGAPYATIANRVGTEQFTVYFTSGGLHPLASSFGEAWRMVNEVSRRTERLQWMTVAEAAEKFKAFTYVDTDEAPGLIMYADHDVDGVAWTPILAGMDDPRVLGFVPRSELDEYKQAWERGEL